jgi:hypothetical protein
MIKQPETWERQLQSKQAIEEGKAAQPGTRCPYSIGGEPWKWASWLAGHYDAWGQAAWEAARR